MGGGEEGYGDEEEGGDEGDDELDYETGEPPETDKPKENRTSAP